MITLTRILHIAVAAAWFGHKLLIPGDLRSSLDDAESARRLMPRLARAEILGIATGLGTLVTGGLLVLLIGPGSVSDGVWVGLGLVLTAIASGAIVARPASNRLRSAVASIDLTSARRDARRLSQLLLVESLLWSAALVAMLV
jgi:hypothetical protein